jgi:hypothetical protein
MAIIKKIITEEFQKHSGASRFLGVKTYILGILWKEEIVELIDITPVTASADIGPETPAKKTRKPRAKKIKVSEAKDAGEA